MPNVFVLLPVYNRRAVTMRFVRCLAAQTHRDWTLVLLDDGSTDGTADAVRDAIPSAVVVTGTGDWWWAGALQRGLDWVAAHRRGPDDVVLMINDDTEFEADFLERGVSLTSSRPGTLFVAQAYDRATGKLADAGRYVDWRRLRFDPVREGTEPTCASTRGLFVRADDVARIGGFHPRLLPHYLSDYEFTIRARRRGFRLATDPSLSVRADLGATGDHDLARDPLLPFMRRHFSNKSARNPLAWTAFLALACPWPWKAWHLGGVWASTGRAILAAAGRSLSQRP